MLPLPPWEPPRKISMCTSTDLSAYHRPHFMKCGRMAISFQTCHLSHCFTDQPIDNQRAAIYMGWTANPETEPDGYVAKKAWTSGLPDCARPVRVDGIGDSATKIAPPSPFFAPFWCNLSVWCGRRSKGCTPLRRVPAYPHTGPLGHCFLPHPAGR